MRWNKPLRAVAGTLLIGVLVGAPMTFAADRPAAGQEGVETSRLESLDWLGAILDLLTGWLGSPDPVTSAAIISDPCPPEVDPTTCTDGGGTAPETQDDGEIGPGLDPNNPP